MDDQAAPKPFSFEAALNDRSSPYYLQTSDNPSSMVVQDRLIGEENYVPWAKAMRMLLVSRRKLGFIDGKIGRPADTNSEEFEAWEMINGLVLSWITHSVEKHIAFTIVYIDIASVAWKDLEERFNQGNGPLLYQLRYELYNLHQNCDPVSVYFNKMKTLWDNLDANINQPTCTCGLCNCGVVKAIQEEREKTRVIQFLLGLDESFLVIRGQILSMQDLPTLGKAYSMVITEEKQKANVRTKAVTRMLDSANAVKNHDKQASPKRFTKSGKKLNTNFFCDHCNSFGHTRDKCWFLLGHPKKRQEKEKEEDQNKKAKIEVAANTLTEDDYKLLKEFLLKTSNLGSNFKESDWTC